MLVPARNVIEKKLVKFSSGLDFTDNHGHITRISDPDELVYVGNSSDVDLNWDKLIMRKFSFGSLMNDAEKNSRLYCCQDHPRGEEIDRWRYVFVSGWHIYHSVSAVSRGKQGKLT